MKSKIFLNSILTLLALNAAADVDLIGGGYVHRISVSLGDNAESPSSLILSFRSRSTWLTNLGYGWCGPWNVKLRLMGQMQYRLETCEAIHNFFPRDSALGNQILLKSRQGAELKLTGPGYIVFLDDGTQLKFNSDIQLVERNSLFGLETFLYDELGRLRRWTTAAGVFQLRYSSISPMMNALLLNGQALLELRHEGEDLVTLRSRSLVYGFEYDKVHNLTAVKEPRRGLTTIEYDGPADRVFRVRDPQKCTHSYQFKSSPQAHDVIVSKTCPGGGSEQRTTTFTMGESGAGIQSVRAVATPRESLYFDSTGRLIERRTPEESVQFKYSPSGQLEVVSRRTNSGPSRSEQISLVYDQDAKLAGLVSSRIGTLLFEYDALGRLSGLSGGANDTQKAQTLSLALDQISIAGRRL